MQTKGFLGIDVSKGYADFLLLGQDKTVLEAGFQLPDSAAGRKQLKALITKWFSEGMEELYCGVESTGGYESHWYSSLKGIGASQKVYMARLNPKGVKSVSDASLKRTITDAVSAENIAVYLIGFGHKVDYGQKDSLATDSRFTEGRQQYTYLRMLQKQKVQLSNQLEKLLYQHFAEMLVYCRHGIPVWLLQVLCKYSCASAVVKAGPARLSAIKGITAEKAGALIEKSSGSNQQPSGQIQHLLAVTAAEILHKTSLVQQEKEYLAALYRQEPQIQLLSSIPGVGIDSAVAILLEIEDITRFGSAKKLSAYFGLHPMFKESGDGIWGNYMSKKGRPEIRAVLFMTAFAGIRCNPILKTLYARFRAKGMKHYQAMGVVMHKLLRTIYGVLKNKQAFDLAVDEKNVEQAAQKQQQNEQRQQVEKKLTREKKHRYLPVSTDAPLSRRKVQKIKKQMASQSSE
jgi:transposase